MPADQRPSTSGNQSGPSNRRDRILAFGRRLFPGLLAATTVAIASRFLSEHYGGPTMLFALLLGMGFHFLSRDDVCRAGIEFASGTLLRFGVALLGLGITIEQIVATGWRVVLIVIVAVLVTLLSGPILARCLGRGWRLGLLTGGAVAICGASAALAIASVLPRNEHSERNTLFTVISVTTLSTIAMVLYPILVQILDLEDQAAGIFIGATVHDVAQVVGAGYSISREAGDTATLVKLLRVAMLIPIVLVIALAFRRFADTGRPRSLRVPLFVFGFAALVLAGSLESFPVPAKDFLLSLSRWCLVIAISAIGMKTALESLMHVGGQAIVVVCAETVLLAVLVLGLLYGWGLA